MDGAQEESIEAYFAGFPDVSRSLTTSVSRCGRQGAAVDHHDCASSIWGSVLKSGVLHPGWKARLVDEKRKRCILLVAWAMQGALQYGWRRRILRRVSNGAVNVTLEDCRREEEEEEEEK